MIFFVKRFLYHESSLSLSLSLFFLSFCCLLVCIVLFFVLFNCLVCCCCCYCFVIYLLFLVVIKPGLEGTAYMHAQKKKLIDPLSKFRVINFYSAAGCHPLTAWSGYLLYSLCWLSWYVEFLKFFLFILHTLPSVIIVLWAFFSPPFLTSLTLFNSFQRNMKYI